MEHANPKTKEEIDFRKQIGQSIRHARRGANLTQKKMADRLGFTSASHVCAIERGNIFPSVWVLKRIEEITWTNIWDESWKVHP